MNWDTTTRLAHVRQWTVLTEGEWSRERLRTFLQYCFMGYLLVAYAVLLLTVPGGRGLSGAASTEIAVSLLLLTLLALHLQLTAGRGLYTPLDAGIDAALLAMFMCASGSPVLAHAAFYIVVIAVACMVTPPTMPSFIATMLGANILATLGLHLMTVGFTAHVSSTEIVSAWVFAAVNVVGIPAIAILLHAVAIQLSRQGVNSYELARTQAELHDTYDRLRESEKMASMGRMTASVAHEMSNNLCAILNSLEIVSRQLGDVRRSLYDGGLGPVDQHTLIDGLERWTNLGRQTAQYSVEFLRTLKLQTRRLVDSEHEVFSVSDCLSDVAQLMRHECTMHGCQLILRTPERAAQISGKRGRFSQVFMNLIKNAVQAYGDVEQAHARPVLVTAEARDGHVLITVSDRGNGIPVQYLGRVFDRAYSTRLAGQGMGYGLAIVQEIVTQDFSGNISVASTPGEGTTFTLVLPQHTAN